MRIIILSFFLLLTPPSYAQEATAELGASFAMADQESIDLAVCLKSGQKCIGEAAFECYIDGQPCEAMIEDQQDLTELLNQTQTVEENHHD